MYQVLKNMGKVDKFVYSEHYQSFADSVNYCIKNWVISAEIRNDSTVYIKRQLRANQNRN